LLLAGCGTDDRPSAVPSDDQRSDNRTQIAAEYDVYLSPEEYASASDVVVIAEFGEIVGIEVDRGGDPPKDPETGREIPGTPMEFRPLAVDEVLVGEVSGDPPPVGLARQC